MPAENPPATNTASNIVRKFVSFPETPGIMSPLKIIKKRKGKNHVDTVFRMPENTVWTGYRQIFPPL
jgi:hypothetical protein